MGPGIPEAREPGRLRATRPIVAVRLLASVLSRLTIAARTAPIAPRGLAPRTVPTIRPLAAPVTRTTGRLTATWAADTPSRPMEAAAFTHNRAATRRPLVLTPPPHARTPLRAAATAAVAATTAREVVAALTVAAEAATAAAVAAGVRTGTVSLCAIRNSSRGLVLGASPNFSSGRFEQLPLVFGVISYRDKVPPIG